MRFSTDGRVRRIDLDPLLGLVPALFGEWAALRFDESGAVLDPLTGEARLGVTLIEGRHRMPDARYRVVARTKRRELPPDRVDEFTSEYVRLTREHACKQAMDEYFRRRRAAQAVTEHIDSRTYAVVLDRDDARGLAVTVRTDDWPAAVSIEVRNEPRPVVVIGAMANLTTLLKADRVPGWVARFLGGTAACVATIDAAALDGGGGRIVYASGRANRFRMQASADVGAPAAQWSVKVRGSLTATGLGRLVLLFARRKLRAQVEAKFVQLWASAAHEVDEMEQAIADFDAAVATVGGPATFVRRLIWEPDHLAGLARDR